jgi:hypothetical protein
MKIQIIQFENYIENESKAEEERCAKQEKDKA